MQNLITWINLVSGTIIGVIGIVLAIVFYRKGKEKKELSYSLRSRTLIRKKKTQFEKLSILYGDKRIDDLCVSNFTIWNSGNKTINASDMVDSKKLTITAIKDSRILDVEVIARSDETNNFSVSYSDEHTATILFEYVDMMEGVVVQIIHTGANDSLSIDCKIKGGLPVKNYDKNRRSLILESVFMNMIRFPSQRGFAIYVTACMVVVLGLAVFFTLRVFDIDLQKLLFPQNEMMAQSPDENQSVVGPVVLSFVFWGYFLSLWAIGIPAVKSIYKIGMPKSLKKFSGFED